MNGGIIGYNNNVILNTAGYPFYCVDSSEPRPEQYDIISGTVRVAPYNGSIPVSGSRYTYSRGVYSDSHGTESCSWYKSGNFPVFALSANKDLSGYNSLQRYDLKTYYTDDAYYYHQTITLPENAVAIRLNGRLYGSCHYGNTNAYSACNEIYMRLEGGTVLKGNRQATLTHNNLWTHSADFDVTLSGVGDTLNFYCWCSAPVIKNVPTTDDYYMTFCPGQDTQGNVSNLNLSISATK